MTKDIENYNSIEWLFTSKFEKLVCLVTVCYKNKQRLHLNIGLCLDFETMSIDIVDDLNFKQWNDLQWFFASKYKRAMYLIKLAYSCKRSFDFNNGIVLNFKTMTIEERY